MRRGTALEMMSADRSIDEKEREMATERRTTCFLALSPHTHTPRFCDCLPIHPSIHPASHRSMELSVRTLNGINYKIKINKNFTALMVKVYIRLVLSRLSANQFNSYTGHY